MSVAACSELVETRDPARFRAGSHAPPETRGALMALYAFNTEIFHAVWATYEPALAEIRLQYWRDQIESLFAGRPVDAHPVLDALRGAPGITPDLQPDMLRLIEARRWDAYKEPFADTAALEAYLADTSGALMAMAGRVLGGREHDVDALRIYGQASGLARFFEAVPELKRRGRQPLPDESSDALRTQAAKALAAMDEARKQGLKPALLPALLSETEARPVLRRARHDPARILEGRLARAPFLARGRALACVLFNLW